MTDQLALFGPDRQERPSTVETSATISADGEYRYLLGRSWNMDAPRATFVMLNPSTADADMDDATIRKCIGFARLWLCGSIQVANLYAYRATDPDDCMGTDDPVGPENDWHLYKLMTDADRDGGPLIVAWGANARQDRVREVVDLFAMIPPVLQSLRCLGTTKAGHPRHPLYVRYDQPLLPWRPE